MTTSQVADAVLEWCRRALAGDAPPCESQATEQRHRPASCVRRDIIVYAYLRLSIVAVGENCQPGYNGPLLHERYDVIREALGSGGWKLELRRVAIAYGPLWISAPLAVPTLRFARRGRVLVGLCLISMTYALDWGRMIFFAAPVIYVSAAYVLRFRRQLAIASVIAFLAVDFGYAGYMQAHGVKSGLDTTAPPSRGPVY